MKHRCVVFGLLASALGLPSVARAHPLHVVHAELREDAGGAVTLQVRWLGGTPPRPLRWTLPAGCRWLREPSRLDASEQRWRGRCVPGALGAGFVEVQGLGERTKVLLAVERPGLGAWRTVLHRGAPRARIPAHGADAWKLLGAYIAMGVGHILSGWDHLAFVLLLCWLVVGWRQLLWTVTAFTMGHSLTLALSVLAWAPPAAPVEAAVAASILWTAIEAASRHPRSVLGRRPAVAALLFGLLHGAAFAGALRELGVPRAWRTLSLFGFNAGIELGQLAFVGAVAAVVAAVRRWRRWSAALQRAKGGGGEEGPLSVPVPVRRTVAAGLGLWAAGLLAVRVALALGVGVPRFLGTVFGA